MTPSEIASEYFRQSKATADPRHKRYLLEQGLRAMGPSDGNTPEGVASRLYNAVLLDQKASERVREIK
jgi:hypothetical protein